MEIDDQSTKTDITPSCGYSSGTLDSGCAHLQLPPGTFCIIPILSVRTLKGICAVDKFGGIPCPSWGSATSHPEEHSHASRFLSLSYTSRSSARYTLSQVPSAGSVPIGLTIPHPFLEDWVDTASQVTVTTYGEHFILIVLRI